MAGGMGNPHPQGGGMAGGMGNPHPQGGGMAGGMPSAPHSNTAAPGPGRPAPAPVQSSGPQRGKRPGQK
jgi:hypothetical protein